MQNQLEKLGNAVKRLGIAIGLVFGLREIILFGKESSEAAMQLSDALTGLKSIVEGQGRSFSAAQSFIEEYTQDGLIPATNAITAYKNVASRGYDDSQIRQVMTALKDASAYGRQASMTMGDAVQSATEGLKNENSILVDNAGVTKNVAKMWEEYAASIGTTANNLTQQQKIQAEVTGILEETKFQTGDAAKVAGSLSGQLQQLSFNFNNLKVAVGNAINPILQNFLPVINTAIQTLTRFANAIASVVGALFGKASVQANTLAESNDSIASTASAGAAAEEELADATTAAGKAAKKSLANFDEINKLQDSTGGGGSSAGVSGGGASSSSSTTVDTAVEDTISPQLQAIADKIKELIEPLREIDLTPAAEAFERLKQAVEPISRKLFEGLEWAWYNILVPLAKWTIGDLLPAFLDLTSASLDVLNEAIEGLQPLGIWLWDEFLKPMAEWTGGVIVDSINRLSDGLEDLATWISEHQTAIDNFSIVLGSLATAFGAVYTAAIILQTIKDIGYLTKGALAMQGMATAMPSLTGVIMAMIAKLGAAFTSIGTWIGGLASSITGAFGAIATTLGISVGWVVAIVAAVAAAVAAIVIYWDEIVAAFQAAWEKIKEVWDVVSGWFNDTVIEPVAEFFAELWESISLWAADAWEGIKDFFAPAVRWFSNLLGSVGRTFSDVFYNIGVIASGCWKIIKKTWNAASSWFNTTVIQPVSNFFKVTWARVTSWASDAWAGIKKVFGNVATFFGDVFGDAWKKVVKVFSVGGKIFSDIKDGILKAFKAVVNGIIRGLNSVIRVPFNGINTALRKIRDISILGLTPFSGLKTISVPQIPYLAKGAVIPPNAPFMAMLGDQKSGTNVEAPLETIKQALAEVMAMYGTGDTVIRFEGDLAQFIRMLKPYIVKEDHRRGGSLATEVIA